MRTAFAILFVLATAAGLTVVRSARADDAPFPTPASDQDKVTVPYVAAAGDSGLVEVVIGRVEATTDTCNYIAIVGDTLSKKNLAGWGIDYYLFERTSNEGESSTKMFCPNRRRVDRFIPASLSPSDGIAISNGHFFLRNFLDGSVFYIPRGFTLKYRAWMPTGDFQVPFQTTSIRKLR